MFFINTEVLTHEQNLKVALSMPGLPSGLRYTHGVYLDMGRTLPGLTGAISDVGCLIHDPDILPGHGDGHNGCKGYTRWDLFGYGVRYLCRLSPGLYVGWSHGSMNL